MCGEEGAEDLGFFWVVVAHDGGDAGLEEGERFDRRPVLAHLPEPAVEHCEYQVALGPWGRTRKPTVAA